MPRRPRKQAVSGVYHVMLRGIERKNIFIDDKDKQRIVETIMEKRKLDGFKMYAFCVMDNHLHLLLKEEKETVSQTIKRIGTSYAYYFNKKYQRVGHLFQDRFRSESIKDEAQLLTAVRYIHNNPVKADIVSHARDYQWSSYKFYVIHAPTDNNGYDVQCTIKDFEDVLFMHSQDRRKATEEFIHYADTVSEDVFIDFDLSDKELDTLKNLLISKKLLNEYGLETVNLNSDRRKLEEVVRTLQIEHGISLRQIAMALGLNRGFVQRLAKCVSK